MTKTIAFANQKGGVRKTTSTATIAYVLSQIYNKKVLLIDSDPQKSLTKKFLPNYKEIPKEATLFQTLKYGTKLQISSTRFANIDIVPSHISLATIDVEIIAEIDARTRIKNAITDLNNIYDYILIDCPPNLGLLVINSLAAADRVIIPLSHLGDETDGMGDLVENINKVKKHLNNELKILGLIQTMVDGTTLCSSFTKSLKENYGDLLFKSQTPRSILMAESVDKDQIIFEYKAPSLRKLAIENSYKELTKEIINKF